MKRAEFSTTTKRKAWERADGKCDGCGYPVYPDKVQYDHAIPSEQGGSADLNNCSVLCIPCHKQKTVTDAGLIAKGKRIRARHIGAHTSRSPLPGGRKSPWRKKMNGKVVPRTK